MTDLQLHWLILSKLLQAAFEELPPTMHDTEPEESDPLVRLQGEFQEFLDRNEFELAWDSLAELGTRLDSGTAFWLNLAEAASNMGLHEKVTEAIDRIRKASGLMIESHHGPRVSTTPV